MFESDNGFEVESSRDSSGLAARPYGFNWGTETGSGAMVKGVQQGMKGMQVGTPCLKCLKHWPSPSHRPTF